MGRVRKLREEGRDPRIHRPPISACGLIAFSGVVTLSTRVPENEDRGAWYGRH